MPLVVMGEAKPGDVMERPFVALPYAQWQELTAAAQREAVLAQQLASEKAHAAAIVADYQAYMREHQVLRAKQKRRGR